MTDLYAIETDPAEVQRLQPWRADSAARQLAARGLFREGVLSRFDMIYLSGITLAMPNGRTLTFCSC